MITIIMLLILFSASTSHAAPIEYDSPMTEMVHKEWGNKPGTCVRSSDIGMYLKAKVDDTHYETISLIGGDVVAHWMLETVKSVFKTKGMVHINVQYLGVAEIPDDDGFPVKYGLWRECK